VCQAIPTPIFIQSKKSLTMSMMLTYMDMESVIVCSLIILNSNYIHHMGFMLNFIMKLPSAAYKNLFKRTKNLNVNNISRRLKQKKPLEH
jgi:hypothetical protein